MSPFLYKRKLAGRKELFRSIRKDIGMKFENMQEFLVLVETRSFWEAADRLFVSQATLSRHIKDMETELGMPLFTHSTRKVELTEFGMLMLPYAKRAVALKREYEEAFSQRINMMNNTINIGSIMSEKDSQITDILAEFQVMYPSIRINLINEESDRLMELLQDNCCDFAFVRERSYKSDDKFYRIPFFKDVLTAYLPETHPLAKERALSLAQLRNETFLMSDESSLTCLLGTQACRDSGFEPDILFKGNRSQTISYLNKGLGVGLMFEGSSLFNFQTSVIGIPIEPPIYAYINLVYKDTHLNQVKKDFLNFVIALELTKNV